MKRRRWITWTLAFAALVAVAAFPGNVTRLVGLIRGESFWHGSPSSYWRTAMQEWISFQRSWAPPTFIERWMAYFGVSVPNRRAELAPIWLMEDDPAAVPVLRELARDSDQDVSAHAVTALRVLREDGRPGLPEFRAALHHPMVMTRLIAVEAVWDLTHEADELVPVLAELLRERDQQVRWRVEGNLHRIGAAAKAAVPAVVQALQSAETADGEVTERKPASLTHLFRWARMATAPRFLTY